MDETKTIVCPECGAENRRSLIVTTCLRCGRSLHAPAPAAPSPPPPEPTEAPPPPMPILPPLPPVQQVPSAELPPVTRAVSYRGEPTPPDGEPLFGLGDSGAPESATLALRRTMGLIVAAVALAVIIGRAVRMDHSPMPWSPNMPAQGSPFPHAMPTMPGGGPMPSGMPAEMQRALSQPLIAAPEPPLPGRGHTVMCTFGGGQLQFGGLRYAVLPQFPAGLRKFSPHPPQGPVVQLEMTARAVPPQGVPFTPTDLRLKDDRGAWSAPVHLAWTGAPQGTALAAGVTLGISVYFAVGADRSPTALGACRPVPGQPATSPVVVAPLTAADCVSPPGVAPKRPQ